MSRTHNLNSRKVEYWFGRIAYVDTSDMWLRALATHRRHSLAVTYANVVLGGVAALVAWCFFNTVLAAALWQFALVSYIGVLGNLNSLMEFDGYSTGTTSLATC